MAQICYILPLKTKTLKSIIYNNNKRKIQFTSYQKNTFKYLFAHNFHSHLFFIIRVYIKKIYTIDRIYVEVVFIWNLKWTRLTRRKKHMITIKNAINCLELFLVAHDLHVAFIKLIKVKNLPSQFFWIVF